MTVVEVTASRLIIPRCNWPRLDQRLWEEALAGGNWLTGGNYATQKRPQTLRNAEKGWGRYLGFLIEVNSLDAQVPPGRRVTPAAVDSFVENLGLHRNRNNSIKTRIMDLKAAMRMLEPTGDFGWLTKPRGVSLARFLPVTLKPKPILDARVLYQWGVDMMGDSRHEKLTISTAAQFRNGLIICVLASVCPRQRALARMRLGQHLVRIGSQYRLSFLRSDIKTKIPLEYDLLSSRTCSMDYYLDAVRPMLLQEQDHDWLWVNSADGGKLSQDGLSAMIKRASKARFGFQFGTHIFRNAIATTWAEQDPESSSAASAMFGTSECVIERHYQRANQTHATRRFGEVLRADRASSRDDDED